MMARARARQQHHQTASGLHTASGGSEGFFVPSNMRRTDAMSAQRPAGDTGDTAEKLIYNEEEMRRAISRIAHEILERNAGARDLVLVGLRTRGLPLAQRLAAKISALEDLTVPVTELDVTN